MNPTLQTIADAAGVSRSTVSLAMRNSPLLPETTRVRIQRIAEEIGYRPNPMISALMANLQGSRPAADRGVIAFLTSYPTRDGWRGPWIFCEYFTGAQEQALRLGYRLEEFWLKEPRMTAARMTTILETRGIAGVIVAPVYAGRGHLSLEVSQFAMVALGYSMTRPKLHRVANHHIESIRLALRELKRKGHRRIALVLCRNQDHRVNRNYSAGYLTFQQDLADADRLPIYWTDGTKESDLVAWIEKHRPSAIVTGSQEDLAWLRKVGLRVPDEISVALVSDLNVSQGTATGIDQQGRLTGAAAVDMIVGQIHRNERGIPSTPKVTLTEGLWVEGDTVRDLDESSVPAKKRKGAVRRMSVTPNELKPV